MSRKFTVMKTFIVLIPINSSLDSRNACEAIENMVLYGQKSTLDVLRELRRRLNTDHSSDIGVEPITDFMDRFNDEEINPDDYFLSYVYTEN